jgi:lipopolysaccharide/colanic/teichoic acid biosynthesis glycosyltransferase
MVLCASLEEKVDLDRCNGSVGMTVRLTTAPSASLHGKGNYSMLDDRAQLPTWQFKLSTGHYSIDRDRLRRATRAIYPGVKRFLDVLVAALALVLLAPLMLAIAIAIKFDSSGPVIYVQRRGGLNGRIFDFYKFRSMTNGHDHTQEHRKFAEAYLNGHAVASQRDDQGHIIYKPASNGHTVTRVGYWLRRTSLDELPQLVNVIRGDMSLVGPRPSMDYEVAMYTDRHRQRLAVVPGLTGWAQINGRSNLSFDQIVSLDIDYIARRSLPKDVGIFLATIPAVLCAKDAG